MSTNTPLPVPSKAAIRALRGLVLGTSCTLALVTEDRRRRINAAHNVLRNSDRLRSTRRYNPGGSALAIALEEDSLTVDPDMVHWNTLKEGERPSSKSASPLLIEWSAATPRQQPTARRVNGLDRDFPLPPAPTEDALEATAATPEAVQRPPPTSPSLPSAPRIQDPVPSLSQQAHEYQTRARLTQRKPNPPSLSSAASERPVDIHTSVSQITKLIETSGIPDLEAATRVLRSSIPAPPAATTTASPDSRVRPLWDASAALCRACQGAGRMDLAQDVLRLAISSQQLDEDAYFAHNPMPVVESLAPLDELKVALSGEDNSALPTTPDEIDARRDAFVQRLRDFTALFLPTLSSKVPSRPASEFLVLGKQLLQCAFVVGQHKAAKTIYSSISRYPGDISELMHWYIGQLHKSQHYKLIVSTFVDRPATASSLARNSFCEVGDQVVEAVRLGHSSKPKEVLLGLLSCCSPERQLRTAWVTDLLYCHWKKFQSYDDTERLFDQVVGEEGTSKTTCHPDGAYRVMIQISLEANKPSQAQAYFDELVAASPKAAGDIRILGLFALSKAKSGDWAGVRDHFLTASSAAGPKGLPARDAERVFVPIVKEYTRTHTIGETEVFLKTYIDELSVPVGRQMVTLLANEYGALREVRSFVSWLEYCAKAGFAVDAAFSNAILRNCRKHWKFAFRDLRTLYRKLCVLSPNFEDKVTQTIMTHAAISDAKYGGRPVKGRVLSLRIAPGTSQQIKTGGFASPLSSAGHYADEDELCAAMKQAFVSGHPSKAVRLYKHAMRDGLPPSSKCLQLAVAAALKGDGKKKHTPFAARPLPPSPADYDAAIDLLKAAQAAGQDIDGAAAYLAISSMDGVGQPKDDGMPGGKDGAAASVQTILYRLNVSQIRVSDLALNRAAFHLFKAGHMRGAISLALAAADTTVGGKRPGYNVWNFSVLVAAYARLADAEGIHMAVQGAAASGVSSELMGFKVLKQARRRLRSYGSAPNVQRAQQAVEDGLERARAARRQLSAERDELQSATLDIMRQAALDAGCEPVDFDEVPFLHRQTVAKGAQGQGGRAAGARRLSSSWDVLEAPASVPVPMVACTT